MELINLGVPSCCILLTLLSLFLYSLQRDAGADVYVCICLQCCLYLFVMIPWFHSLFSFVLSFRFNMFSFCFTLQASPAAALPFIVPVVVAFLLYRLVAPLSLAFVVTVLLLFYPEFMSVLL